MKCRKWTDRTQKVCSVICVKPLFFLKNLGLEKSFSPDSLGDGDVSRAILLGLHACGVAAVEVPVDIIQNYNILS